ncbi:DUF4236 domain-containing protein [Butyrivibrio sp. AE2032]|uniref:DUF4236 domain-containing protein n=1 Tax=Butyrivibrio sp. AE2032 TaxID=1458463 RepID=UPI0005591F8E|nr:DUF4236 domain-containing protein [Butyrivibrio sp. AE2032]
MGLNFRKSISLGKGLKLNLSKSGPSVSFGKSGFRQSVNLKGQARTTVGIPGTGIYYTKTSNVKNIVGGLTGKDKDTSAKGKKAAGKAAGEKAEKAPKTTKAAAAAPAKNAVNEELIAESKAKIEEFAAGIEALKSVHKQSDGYIDWEAVANGAVSGQMKELQPFAQSVLAGDIDSYFQVISEVGPFDDLLEYGSGFEVGTDDPKILEIEFQVKSDKIIPTEYPDMKASGELVMKEFSKSAYYELVQDYVSSTMLRIARDTFAILPVQTVIIHAVDKVLNPATGNDEEVTICSAKIKRDALATLNFERIDPSDCLESFESNVKFRKTSGYAPVDRVLA